MSNAVGLNLEGIPKELRFLLEIIKIENDQSEQLNNLEWNANINWTLFVELSIHHRLYPLLYFKLKLIDQTLFPPHIKQILYQHYKENTFQMLLLSAEMEQVSKLFSENQIPLLMLKGPVLASELYGDLSLRTCGDLDVLVEIDHLNKIDEMLTVNGYVKDEIKTVFNDWKWRLNHITYFHPQKMVTLEIHWRLNPGPGKEPAFKELWERKRICSFTSHPVYSLGKEDLFFFLVTHGARHGWFRLRWLADIHQIIRKNLDWPQIRRLLTKYHYQHLGGQALILSSELLSSQISKDMKTLVVGKHPKQLAQQAIFFLERIVNLHTDPVPEDVDRFHKRYLFSLKTMRQQLFFIISFFYPSPIDAETMPLPKVFHFLYFPLRPFLCVWRRKKA